MGLINMNDTDIVAAYVRYFMEGAASDSWAPEELNELASRNPDRAWEIIQRINATRIESEEWQQHVYAALGCGALEELIVLHEKKMLPVILTAAKEDPILRLELSTIYESSVSPSAWSKIRTFLA